MLPVFVAGLRLIGLELLGGVFGGFRKGTWLKFYARFWNPQKVMLT